MPRRRTRRRQPLSFRPLTFSPFARSVARVASSRWLKNQIRSSKLYVKSHPSKGNVLAQQSSVVQSGASESDEEFEGVVQVDFLFFDPKPDDFHGVKTLLQTYLDDKLWDLSGFVDLVLGQTTVGTVVKVEDDEDNGVFSFVTALNLGRYKDNACIKELKEFLHEVCHEKDILSDLTSLLGEQQDSVGLLVSQRVLNLPPQLLPPLYDGLFKEVEWATNDEKPTAELCDSFRFNSYLILSKVYLHKNVDSKKRVNDDNDEAIIYIKPEDQLLYKLCSWSFFFPLRTQQSVTHELRNYRLMGLVMAVEASKVSTFWQELKSLVDES